MTEKEMRTLSKVADQLIAALRETCRENVNDRINLALEYIDEMLPEYDDSNDEHYEDDCWEALSSVGDMDFNY